ncbi:MAG: hypothetical protein LUG95_06360 [Clostridiales bacterium]|nr:hypothetical protein [Clostridiales bacterium]
MILVFYNNVKSTYEAGLKFGVYLYSYAYNTTEATAEANFVLSVLATVDSSYLENMVLPVAYDLENKLIINTGKCTKDEITANALAFSSVISSAGYTPMVYTNDNWFKNYINPQQLYDNGIKIWYAYWTNTTSTQLTQISGTGIPCYIWQYQSGSNHDSELDQNILYINDMALADIKLSYSSVTYDGYEKCPQVSVYLGMTQLVNGTDYTVAYSDNINASTATVIITGTGEYSGTISKTFKIKAIASSSLTLKLSKTSYVYNGKAKKPTVTVADNNGNVISSDNYTVTYASGRKKVGEYNVTVKFSGNYSDTKSLTFTIKPKA